MVTVEVHKKRLCLQLVSVVVYTFKRQPVVPVFHNLAYHIHDHQKFRFLLTDDVGVHIGVNYVQPINNIIF